VERVHEPVLLSAVLEWLAPSPGQTFVDGTLGLGGHALEILPRLAPGGTLIGIDLDPEMLAEAQRRFSQRPVESVRIELLHGSYADLAALLARLGIEAVDGILLDLGVNSAQLDDSQRGFSFDREGPLDMRFDRGGRRPALELVNSLPERELADLLFTLGEERMSRKIAQRICAVRRASRITTTRALARVCEAVYGPAAAAGRIHPATRTFQALRIAVNRELDNLQTFLGGAAERLRPDGRVGVISFHSLEDGMVKRAFREGKARGLLRELTKQPLTAEREETARNPRARSAKLRAAQRC
jgi:16S rRNA (cytosine1402-N4)-methyltransferase